VDQSAKIKNGQVREIFGILRQMREILCHS